MLTKILATILLTGSLVVTGDATFQKIGCCLPGSDCCPFSACCPFSSTPTSTETNSTETKSDCCSAPSRTKVKSRCCSEE